MTVSRRSEIVIHAFQRVFCKRAQYVFKMDYSLAYDQLNLKEGTKIMPSKGRE